MNDQINLRCSESFREDVKEYADERGQSVSEYLREAARRQMQRDIINGEQE